MDQQYDNEVLTIKVEARSRLFYVDLKKSANGYFVKISEKSMKGRSTIMFDEEDLPKMIEALQQLEVKRKSLGDTSAAA
jgi:hypothetical protein